MIFARKSKCLPAFAARSLRCAALGAAFLCGAASAQGLNEDAGTAQFQYLDMLVFARPAGLAGAYTSLASGIDAVGYNPAGVSRPDTARMISGTMRYHLLGVGSGNVTYGFPGATGRSYAFSVAYVNYGRIAEMDEQGNATGREFIPASFNPSFTAAGRWSDKVKVGATLRGLSEYLGDFTGSEMAWGWGVDAGMQYQPSVKNLGFGLSLLNVGRKEGGHFNGDVTGGLLPVSLKGGFFYSPLELPKGRVAVDLEVPWHDVPLVSGGFEYAYSPSLILRAGSRINWTEARHYFLEATDQNPGDLMGGNALKLASGFTFQSEGLALDYAVQYWLDLSWVHALTLRYALQ